MEMGVFGRPAVVHRRHGDAMVVMRWCGSGDAVVFGSVWEKRELEAVGDLYGTGEKMGKREETLT
jgi:hypothetical protein